MTSYPFRQGLDYGPRDGTLGLSFHMSEGGDGLVGFLSRHPGEDIVEWGVRVNGVSCHVALLSDGTPWRMLDWDHCSGNLNPAHRAGEYGYYGGHHLRDVLGSHWVDPNMWTLSMEIAGYRAAGPTDKQRDAAIAWGLEMRDRFPTIRGATGHHDQSPKPCPGLTANMKAIFEGIGGHGLFTATPDTAAGDDVRFINSEGYDVQSGKLLPVKANTAWQTLDGKVGGTFSADAKVPVVGRVDAHTGQYAVLLNTGSGVIYPDNVTRPTIVLVPSTAALLDAPATPPVTPTTATTLAPGLYEVKAA